MRTNRPQRTLEQLYPVRLAWRAVEQVLASLDLSSIALRLNPDDTSQGWTFEDGTIGFSEDFRERWHMRNAAALVRVDLEAARARVTIPRVDQLVRRQHVHDLDERADLGGGFGPDVDVSVDLSEAVRLDGELLRTSPPRPPPPERARPYHMPVSRRSQGR